jgi:hypothetical protein
LKMQRLLRVILRSPHVDEVEIDVRDQVAAQVRAAEIGFADFLWRFVGLIVIVVGV